MIEYHNAKVLNHHSITRRGFKGRTHASGVSIMYYFLYNNTCSLCIFISRELCVILSTHARMTSTDGVI